jgi:hypothetical protein
MEKTESKEEKIEYKEITIACAAMSLVGQVETWDSCESRISISEQSSHMPKVNSVVFPFLSGLPAIL